MAKSMSLDGRPLTDDFYVEYKRTFKFELGQRVIHKLLLTQVGVVLSQSLVRSGDPGFSRVYLVKVMDIRTDLTKPFSLGTEYWMESEIDAFEDEAKQLPSQ